MKKKLKVLMLFYSPYQKPRGYDYKEEFADPDNMYTEKDVHEALKDLGHEVSLLGIFNDIAPLFEEIRENKPDVIFNMMEVFNDQTNLEKNMAVTVEPGIYLPKKFGVRIEDSVLVGNKAEVMHKFTKDLIII